MTPGWWLESGGLRLTPALAGEVARETGTS